MGSSTTNTAARELLAAEYERSGSESIAQKIRNPAVPVMWWSDEIAIRAIEKALTKQQGGEQEGDGLSRIHAMFRMLGFDGLEALPGWGWSYSRSGCAVEAMIENGILLEHFDDWVGFHPSDNTSKQAAGEAGT